MTSTSSKHKVLAIIPARGGSKGVPHKNSKLLGNIPLIGYTIEFAKACKWIDEIFVSTDDEVISRLAKSYGIEPPILRPAHLATDISPTINTVIHVLNFLEEQGEDFDVVCLLQPTVPFRDMEEISNAYSRFIGGDGDSLISVRRVPHTYHPQWIYEEGSSGFLEPVIKGGLPPRRQVLKPVYHRDGSLYLCKKQVVLTNKSLYGEKVDFYEISVAPNINIDTVDDWKLAEDHLDK